MDLPLTVEQFEALAARIADYQLSRGSLLAMPVLRENLDSPVPIARTVGVSAVPAPFPAALYFQALRLQQPMNALYARVASDPDWLGSVLAGLRRHDEFVAKLWRVWERVRDEGVAQELECGVWRSDYMMQAGGGGGEKNDGGEVALSRATLKQVEFNTYSCAGGAHANIVADMHAYLAARGLHSSPPVLDPDTLPRNATIDGIVRGLERAHRAYEPAAQPQRRVAVLMTVQPRSVNACDEQPIEQGLWRCDPPVALFSAKFSDDVLQHCRLGPNRELLYRPPGLGEGVEVSVVYQRAAYDAEEHDEQGVEARLLLERSRAVKCPSVLGHLAGLKKVQQELARPGALERFVDDAHTAQQIRDTFVGLYPMDESEQGQAGRELALQEDTANAYVLKPSLEGGAHNTYGDDIPEFLRQTEQERWANYILMERISPPELTSTLVSYLDEYSGPVISELGVFGTCLWKRRGKMVEMLDNVQAGWSFKTKPADVDEMSVVKGFGCFDCPRLIG